MGRRGERSGSRARGPPRTGRRSGSGPRSGKGPKSRRGEPPVCGNEEGRLRALFQKVDADGSGKIGKEELGTALGSGSWEPFNSTTVSLLIAMFDANGDGEIGWKEFQPLWKYVSDWQATFHRYDRDNSGDIDARELGKALAAFGYRFSPDFSTFLTQHFDRGQDGALAFDDFVEACVLLLILTDVFRARDNRRAGSVRYDYEAFLTDCLRLLVRFQLC